MTTVLWKFHYTVITCNQSPHTTTGRQQNRRIRKYPNMTSPCNGYTFLTPSIMQHGGDQTDVYGSVQNVTSHAIWGRDYLYCWSGLLIVDQGWLIPDCWYSVLYSCAVDKNVQQSLKLIWCLHTFNPGFVQLCDRHNNTHTLLTHLSNSHHRTLHTGIIMSWLIEDFCNADW